MQPSEERNAQIEREVAITRERVEMEAKATLAMRAILLQMRRVGLMEFGAGYTHVANALELAPVRAFADELRFLAAKRSKGATDAVDFGRNVSTPDLFIQFPDDPEFATYQQHRDRDEYGHDVAVTYFLALSHFELFIARADAEPVYVQLLPGESAAWPGSALFSFVSNLAPEIRAGLFVRERAPVVDIVIASQDQVSRYGK